MVFYLVSAIVILTILIYIVTELIHLPKKKFKKYVKYFFLIFIICIVLFLMRFFPAVITSIPAIFLILFRWGNFINFVAKVFLRNKIQNFKKENMTKKEALEILGLDENASKEEIIKSHQKLIKKNHPDVGGSDWVTKKLNKARDILLG
ncbi:MAG: molecular chaperone DnaJ [Pelagibacteraceae bacterium TMED124]|nr:molecular chaperone DnaJ [Rickettsiales bacterium]RPG16646.1 MAG: molecular chaperone DnaJ [Pelagibacteraceae bacterium TMED124]